MADPDALLAAVRAGDATRVRALLAEDPTLAATTDETGTPAVRLALHRRKPEALAARLEADPPLDPLRPPAPRRPEQLERALAGEPDILTRRTHEGFTALHLAAFTGGPE